MTQRYNTRSIGYHMGVSADQISHISFYAIQNSTLIQLNG